ncbi:MAG: hypothetical protein IKB01_11615 [Lachnospiraceae bacterium]|nr:hypothetical protein [Lachnospiraceae bacterium]
MKKFLKCLCIFLFAGIVLLFACTGTEEEKDFFYYEDMDEIVVEGNQITLVLYEDQALPYRWDYSTSTSGIALLEDKSVDDESFSVQAGVSESYRVFVFECKEGCQGNISLQLVRIAGDEGEIRETRLYNVLYIDGQLSCNGVVEMNN